MNLELLHGMADPGGSLESSQMQSRARSIWPDFGPVPLRHAQHAEWLLA